MTLTEALADRALEPAAPAALDYLRALTLGNAAAGLGYLGNAESLVARLPFDTDAPAGAAFSNAMLMHARTQDDFYPAGRVHVGVVTLAATLALEERVNGRLLACLAAGYETMCAVARVYSGDAQRRGFRPTGIFGPLGAAASAAVALELDREGVANALGLAAARSAGTNQSWLSGTDEWLFEVAYAARSGVEAALLTEAGVVASRDSLEGRAGWAQAYFGDEGASRLAADLEHPASHILEVAQKPYPVSGIAQVSTRLGCEVHEATVAFPEAVVVRLSPAEADYPGSANGGPFRSRSDALMSVAFCVTCGLSDGIVRLDRLERPHELEDLVKRVRLVPDPSLGEGQAVVEYEIDGTSRAISGDAASILYAPWEQLAADGSELAARSEAPAPKVAELRGALTGQYADARTINRLLRSSA